MAGNHREAHTLRGRRDAFTLPTAWTSPVTCSEAYPIGATGRWNRLRSPQWVGCGSSRGVEAIDCSIPGDDPARRPRLEPLGHLPHAGRASNFRMSVHPHGRDRRRGSPRPVGIRTLGDPGSTRGAGRQVRHRADRGEELGFGSSGGRPRRRRRSTRRGRGDVYAVTPGNRLPGSIAGRVM